MARKALKCPLCMHRQLNTKDSPTTSPAYHLPTANKLSYQQTPTRRLTVLPVAQNKVRFPVPTLDTQFSPTLFAPHPQKPQYTAVNQQRRSTALHSHIPFAIQKIHPRTETSLKLTLVPEGPAPVSQRNGAASLV